MNSRLISNGADKIIEVSDSTAGLAGGRREAAGKCAEALFSMILQDVLLPEYNRWRDVDGEIGIGASGALANVIAKLTIGLDEGNR